MPFASAVLETLEHYGIWNLIQPAVRRFIDLLVGKQVPTPSDVEHLRGPRIIKTHLTFNLLNPDVLEKSKVTTPPFSFFFFFFSFFFFNSPLLETLSIGSPVAFRLDWR